jgi:hypothetical protein
VNTRTQNSRRNHKLRKKAQSKLRRVYGYDLQARCAWCHEEIVWLCAIRRRNRISTSEYGYITYRTLTGKVVRKAQASVDHVEPLRVARHNGVSNLVPSCVRCNVRRTPTNSPYTDDERRVCTYCGNWKQKGRSRCNECFRKIVGDWKIQQTMAELFHFVDPLPVG